MKHESILLNRNFKLFFAAMILISVFAGCIYLGPRLLNMDGDLGRHLTVGAYILDSGKIPTSDIFSHTLSGSSFTPHEWLSEVLFVLAYRLLGLTGVVLLTAIVIGSVWYILSYKILSNIKSFYVSLILILIGIAASSIHWISRPHIFTYIFLLIWITVYHSSVNLRRKCLFLFTIMVLWVNFHGAFITGVVYIFIDLFGRILPVLRRKYVERGYVQIRKIGIILAVSICAIFVNPVGYHILNTVFGFLGNQYLVTHTMEYQAPNLMTAAFVPFYVFLVISVSIMLYGRKETSSSDLLQVVTWSIFGLMSARNIPLAVFVGLPILSKIYGLKKYKESENKEVELPQPVNRSYRVGAILIPISILLLAGILFGIFPTLGTRNVFLPDKFPDRAVDYIKQHSINGNMFNEFTWGGYLLYRLWPEQKVFIDGQTDFYGEKVTREYEEIYNADPGYAELLKKYNISWVIVQRTAKIAEQLDKDSAVWAKEYSDQLSVIFLRK